MRPEEATSSILSEVWSQVRPQIQKSRFLEEAAQALATSLHTQFDESVVIARIFVTVPFNSLPRANKEFVRNLVEAAEAASDLKPGTPVLSLIGTHGQEEDWNDRRKSKGHVGIPLISSAFVDTIPMISRLLKELGVPLEWLDSHDAQIIVQSSGGTEALFFVDDALQAADEEGRKIISAQDFVSSYQVKSVFGTGGVYASGQIFVVVVFCRDSFARADAESFLALTQSFKNETASFSSSGSIFSVVGQTLSHYRILEKIGEGGMGEVYRAEDTSLKREVAIKVLPDRFTEDPERLARFEREAKLVASLNHPNLAAIYESEEADGKRFLVLELVKGETLAERLTKGPLPVEEALKVCLQVAKGIEAAHEEGVIHRDLKPANVQITPEGKVKILDFGLAKAFEGETSAAFSQAPTRAGETTKTGVIVGTTAYMSLEQARGEPVDERTDIWNFGCVLFECLTGKRAFEGETITETIAAVLTDNPQWDALPENTPWSIRTLLLRCLEKEANRRLRGMSDAKIEIEKALAEPTRVSGIEVTSAAQPARWRQVITLSITAVLASFVTGIAIWMFMPSSPPSPQLSKKLVITSLLNTTLFNNPGRNLAISPDGRRIAYQILSNGRAQLYLRSLDEFTTTLIPGTETMTGSAPIFSPDGESVLFVADSKLRKVSLPRGTPVTLSEMTRHRGGSWGPGDVIFLASDDDLYRVSAAGGEPEMLATVDREKGEVEYRQPEILPDGKALLFTIGRQNSSQIAILSLETGEKKIVVEGGREAHYAPTGHLVYEAAAEVGTLMAASFDPERQEITGQSVPVLSGISSSSAGTMDYDFSGDGTLVYIPARSVVSTLVWVDRQGKAQPLTDMQRAFRYPRLSPDGRRVAVTIRTANGANIWIYDIARGTLTPLTFEGVNRYPVWILDGRRLAFSSDRAGSFNLFWMQADGTGEVEQLSTSLESQIPFSWSPDGLLAYRQNTGGVAGDIWFLPLKGERKPQPFLATQFFEFQPTFSPDGRWIAFVSNRSGQFEVYVTPYPGPGGMMQISTDGGEEPLWAPDGQELFYRIQNQDKMMAVSIQTEPTFKAGTSRLLFEGAYAFGFDGTYGGRGYDVDSKSRFLMIKEEEQTTDQINVVLNWFEELKRLVPTD